MKASSDLRAERLVTLCAIACLLLAGAASAHATDDGHPAQALLQRMTHAVRATNYVGVCIYRFGDDLQAIRIIHQVKDGHRRERLVSLNGAAQEIIRDNAQATYILADDHALGQTQSLLDTPLSTAFSGNVTFPEDLHSLLGAYALELMGTSRVAGRVARRLDIVPHDHFRYGYHLWIDEKSGLLLRSDLIDVDAEPVEQIMFTQLETPTTIPDEWLEPTLTGDKITWTRKQVTHAATAPSSAPAWQVGGLPAGFRLTLQERHPGRGDTNASVEHRLYSDGLATVSVYIRRQEGNHPFNGWSRMGAVSAFGRTLDHYQIVVVGEVPPSTVQQIGESVRGAAEEP